MDKSSTKKKPVVKKTVAKKKTTTKRKVSENSVKKKSVSKNPSKTRRKGSADKKVKPRLEKESESILVLSPVLGTSNAKGLYNRFCRALSLKKDTSIDASSVKMVDTAILQLLVAFVKKVESKKLSVIWVNPSEDFISRARSLDLIVSLGLNGAD